MKKGIKDLIMKLRKKLAEERSGKGRSRPYPDMRLPNGNRHA